MLTVTARGALAGVLVRMSVGKSLFEERGVVRTVMRDPMVLVRARRLAHRTLENHRRGVDCKVEVLVKKHVHESLVYGDLGRDSVSVQIPSHRYPTIDADVDAPRRTKTKRQVVSACLGRAGFLVGSDDLATRRTGESATAIALAKASEDLLVEAIEKVGVGALAKGLEEFFALGAPRDDRASGGFGGPNDFGFVAPLERRLEAFPALAFISYPLW